MTAGASARTFGATTLLAATVGLLLSVIAVVANEGFAAVRNPLDALLIAAFATGPAVLFSSLVAGYAASRLLQSARSGWSVWRWVACGVALGSATGALSSGGWFRLINLGNEVSLRWWLSMAGIGAVAGAFAGTCLALYCWHVARVRFAV